ncbi:MAG: hypothetical protein ABT15_16145 [Pseudonocardia sp. SCN 73-27]|nr:MULTISPECIES: hypothetical protein [unclassified Pseudonocardia]ODU21010.1 MAG: hypothetical protein ABS80_17920 [Pseudonocardia sp. SCN 72-51]ODV05646.1 MAG: hypothetical protein ABT15_16145 [Pseudonocardia sp. SCN 73-27]
MVHDVHGSDPGRPDRADPSRVNDRDTFVGELQLLKDRSGLSFRDIARGTGGGSKAEHPLPFTSIRDYVSGTCLPPADRLGRIVRALGESETAVEGWLAALRRVRDAARAPAAGPDESAPGSALTERTVAPCPYRGLAANRIEDAELFHGRDRLLADLLHRLGPLATTGGLLTVVGPSGSGKSSLLHAGLVPALLRGDVPAPDGAPWHVAVFVPGEDPATTLAEHIVSAGGGPAVIVVDQLEQVFTGVTGAAERDRFPRMVREVGLRRPRRRWVGEDRAALEGRRPPRARTAHPRRSARPPGPPGSQDRSRPARTGVWSPPVPQTAACRSGTSAPRVRSRGLRCPGTARSSNRSCGALTGARSPRPVTTTRCGSST